MSNNTNEPTGKVMIQPELIPLVIVFMEKHRGTFASAANALVYEALEARGLVQQKDAG